MNIFNCIQAESLSVVRPQLNYMFICSAYLSLSRTHTPHTHKHTHTNTHTHTNIDFQFYLLIFELPVKYWYSPGLRQSLFVTFVTALELHLILIAAGYGPLTQSNCFVHSRFGALNARTASLFLTELEALPHSGETTSNRSSSEGEDGFRKL